MNLFTVTFHANPAHNLTCPLSYIFIIENPPGVRSLAWAPDATRLVGLSLDGAIYVWSASNTGAARGGGGGDAAGGAARAASVLTTMTLESSWDNSAVASRVRGIPPARQRDRPVCAVDVQWWSPTAVLMRFDDGVVSIAALEPTLRGTRAEGEFIFYFMYR